MASAATARRQSERCACGKLSLASERAAEKVVLEARIARALRDNQRRGENRHYRCRYGRWHTTSQARRGAGSAC